ncbi:MAG: membrane protein insertion efficiency factor YidD [Candidatus Lambdaproteobacteria bacterium]|nr:membrane protein insertion efficiency factor YidD [Candidatus Lambdaproteobacteria bacterium]
MAHVLILLLRGYKLLISPLLPPACRFYPTCSVYAMEAIDVHGSLRGSWLAARRLLKCQPFHPGGVDLVPPRARPPAARRHDRHHHHARPASW